MAKSYSSSLKVGGTTQISDYNYIWYLFMPSLILTIPGYILKEQIYTGKRTIIHKGIRERDNRPVILKTLIEEFPSLMSIARLEHEKNILQVTHSIDGRYLDFIQHENRKTVVFNDEGEETLANYLNNKNLSLQEILVISIHLVDILGQIHQLGIIHKDIKPENILMDPKTFDIKIIDFGIASQLSQETQEVKNPNVLEGSISYIAPEQTGRMNRPIDYRSDFYALGITLYFILTGQLPFVGADPMEFIHYHITKIPPSPHDLKASIPTVLSDIIMKLVSKKAEDRYQSAYGLKVDLENCLNQLESKGQIDDFSIAAKDIHVKFIIPHKLYGREKEQEILLEAYESICKGNKALLLVTGHPGIGKSTLVQEIHRSIVKSRGYFITGKFDQFQREIPYHAFTQAFSQMAKQILTEDDQKLEEWENRFRDAIGQNGKIITDMIPEMELIIGSQPPLTNLSIQENQNRFELVLQNFIQSLTSPEHPLTIVIDDLQWADLPSLKLVEKVLTNPYIHNLLIIGAYRDNEVDATHRLTLTLEGMRKYELTINTISLGPLTLPVVRQFVADTLHASEEQVQPLAELCYAKTLGNPFFLNQFLQTLYQEKLLRLNIQRGSWDWNLEEIKNLNVTDNVVELMANKIRKLDPALQELLKLCACIGSIFDLRTLSIVYKKSPQETASELWPALQEGLIIPASDNYKFANTENISVSYRFLHDRVQQAIYSLIDEDQKKEIYLKVGRLLFKNSTEQNLEEMIFDIVNHYNPAVELVTDKEERLKLTKLNLIAGKKAKAANAYQTSLEYLDLGTSLLESSSWKTDYQLTLDLYVEKAEAAYLSAKFDLMDKLAIIILRNVQSPLDKIKIIQTKILGYITRNNLQAAINQGIDYCNELGASFPKKTTFISLLYQITKSRLLLYNATVDSIVNLPLMTDPYKIAIMQISRLIASCSYRASPFLFIRLMTGNLQLSYKYGNTEMSPIFYFAHAMVLCGALRNISEGYKFGQAALKLLGVFPHAKVSAPISLFIFAFFVGHWKMHLRDTLNIANDAIYKGLEVGDLEYVAYAETCVLYTEHLMTNRLDLLEKKIFNGLQLIKQIHQTSQYQYDTIIYQAVLNLQNKTKHPTLLAGKDFDLEALLLFLKKSNDQTGLHFLYQNQMILHYLFYEYPEAYECAKKGRETVEAILSMILEPIFYYYDSLIRLANYPNLSSKEQRASNKIIKKNQKFMKEWAFHAPMNYKHRYYLVEAERASIEEGKWKEALENYDLAISLAQEHGYLRDEALANELAGAFFVKNKNVEIAKIYLKKALYAYTTWGAVAKVNHLEKVYSEIIPLLKFVPTASQTVTTETSETTSTALDSITSMKSSQAISEEIELNKLIVKLLGIVIENTGAERGLLFLKRDTHLFLEGLACSDKTSSCILESIPIEQTTHVPISVIQYVERTKEFLVLGDASNRGEFLNDPYILSEQIKSILCIPIIHQQNLIGVLYCENRLISDTFTQDRVELLKVLSSQIAISIQNATLFSELNKVKKNLEEYSVNLEHIVADRTSELKTKNNELQNAIDQLKSMQKQIIQQEKLASLGMITQGISHEIMNPLNFVNNFSGVSVDIGNELEEELEKPLDKVDVDLLKGCAKSLKDYLSRIQHNGFRISNIVKSMQELAKVGSAEKDQALDLQSLLDNIIEYLNMNDKTHSIEYKLESDIEENLPKISGYPAHFRKALLNILDNSYDALLEKNKIQKKENLYIRLSVKRINESIQITIADNGIGIPEADMDKIFVPFFTTKPQGQGKTGLGLSIAYDIIENEHNGRIAVESKEGKGTTVLILLPVK